MDFHNWCFEKARECERKSRTADKEEAELLILLSEQYLLMAVQSKKAA